MPLAGPDLLLSSGSRPQPRAAVGSIASRWQQSGILLFFFFLLTGASRQHTRFTTNE